MKWTESLGGGLREMARGRYVGVLIGLLMVSVYLSFAEPSFLTWDNFANIARANTALFILAMGMTFVLLTGGIDLSVASLTAACVIILGQALEAGWNWLAALAVAAMFGIFLGLINGFLIGVVGISFAVVTLGSLSVYEGFALLASDGEVISLFAAPNLDPVESFVNNDVGVFPVLLIVSAVIFALAVYVLRYTSYGRSVYAVGSNPEAARLMGIRVQVVIVSVYAMVGLCAALAGLVQVGRLTGAAPQPDPTLLLTVVAAVLIGGTSFTGGEGGVFGTLIGVLFLSVIQNGLALGDISTFWQPVVSGTVLVMAVGLNVLRDQGWSLRRLGASAAQRGLKSELADSDEPASRTA